MWLRLPRFICTDNKCLRYRMTEFFCDCRPVPTIAQQLAISLPAGMLLHPCAGVGYWRAGANRC